MLNFRVKTTFALVVAVLLVCIKATGGEGPYFVTYDHHMEEPGSLEVGANPVLGKPKNGNPFLASWTEIEYGVKGWWTTEFYLEGQTTRRDSTVFTGYRLENRFRPLLEEHWINPVLYVEFEDINAASKTLQEVVGFDSQADHAARNAESRAEKEREIEAKLILGSEFRGWNISENLIFEKNLANAPWEFGYALGVNRPLALAASPRRCNLCRENFRAGVELYGGLGDWQRVTTAGTSQYVAPVVSWELANGASFRISPTFGMTQNSHRFLIRFGVSQEFGGFGRRVRRMFR
ncbi:MAG: hypothetical protein ACYDA9_18980 [Terriglobia bacterium]